MEKRNNYYCELNCDEIVKRFKTLEQMLGEYLQKSEFEEDLEYKVNKLCLMDAITRTDKRKSYYEYFHKMNISEKKMVSILAYWLIKLKPLHITDPRYLHTKKGRVINEKFAIYLIFSVLSFTKDIGEITDCKYYEKLLYSFRYRTFSVDAMMLLTESITEKTFLLAHDDAV